MKKRVLSLLLLLAMVVTALPLVALPVVAAEETPEFAESEYNKLYHLEDLFFAADFYRSNQYWNPDGKELDKTTASYKWTVGGNFSNDAKIAEFGNGYVHTANLLDGNSGTTRGEFYLDGTQTNAVVDGTYDATQEIVATHTAADGWVRMNVNGLWFGATLSGDSATLTAKGWPNGDGKGPKLTVGGVAPSVTAANGAVKANTYTVALAAAGLTGTDTADVWAQTEANNYFAFYVNGSSVIESNEAVMAADPAHYNQKSAIRYWSSSYDLYAVRYYHDVLTAAEVAKNHFADLVKWFKLDLTYIRQLSDTSVLYMTEVDGEMVPDAAITALTFDSKREDVVAAIEAKAKSLYIEQVASEKVPADVLEVAIARGLDVSPLIRYPEILLPKTYAFLRDEAFEGDAVATYEAMLAADLGSSLEITNKDEAYYNALYVQDDLLYAIDFYRNNSYWASAEGLSRTSLVNDYFWNKGANNGVSFSETGEYDLSNGYIDMSALNNAGTFFKGVKNPVSNNTLATTYETVAAYGAPSTKIVGINGLFFDASWPADNKMGLTFSKISIDGIRAPYPEALVGGTARPSITYLTDLTSAVTYSFALYADGITNAGATFDWTGYEKPTFLGNLQADSFYVGWTVNDDGSVSETTAAASTVRYRYRSHEPITHEYDGKVYIVGATERTNTSVYGDGTPYYTPNGYLGLYANGTAVQKITNMGLFSSVAFYTTNTHLRYYSTGMTGKLYASRQYGVKLTDTQIAQNHFADLAKWFRLNVEGIEALKDASPVYAAVANYDFNSDRETVQVAVLVAIREARMAEYEEFKGVNPQIPDSFVDLAASYFLDIRAVVDAKRDMSHVIATVTADALAGKTTAEAQEKLDEAYFAAWHYISYQVDGSAEQAAAYNAQLTWCAENCSIDQYVDLEGLMALPYADRLGTLGNVPTDSVEAAQAYIDAYVAEAMRKYEGEPMTEAQYNALYEQNGLFFAADFYRNNAFWLEDGATPSDQLQSYRWFAKAYFGRDNTKEAMTEGGYLATSNLPANEIAIVNTEKNEPVDGVYAATQEMVAKYSANFNPAIKVNGLWIGMGVSGSTLTLNKFTWGEGGVSLTGTDTVALPNTASSVHSFAVSLSATGLTGAGGVTTGKVSVFADGAEAYTKTDASFVNDLSYYTQAGLGGRSTIRYWGHNYDLYAVRYYTVALDESSLQRNAIADLAKWYRLDMTGYNPENEDQVEALYKALIDVEEGKAPFAIGESTEEYRAAVQAAVNAALLPSADGIVFYEDDAKNAAFIDFALGCGLDLSPVRMLSAESRTAVADALIAEFNPNYAYNAKVVRYYYAEMVETYAVMTFAGYQVRIDTGSADHNYAGVRAVFDLDETVVAKLLDAGKTVSVRISIKQGEHEVSYITISAAKGDEDAIVYTAEKTDGSGTVPATIYDRATATGTAKSVNYTVTYKGDSATAERFAEEYSYAYTITVGEVETEFVVNSNAFGASVSAAELYGYFGALDEYKDDVVVKDVLAKVAAAE